MGRMIDKIRENNNQFWVSARNHHLDAFLERVYRDDGKRQLMHQWLGRDGCKRVVFQRLDCEADPLLIEFTTRSCRVQMVENEPWLKADVLVYATHTAIISYSYAFRPFIYAWLRGKVRVPLFWTKPRDHYYAARIFLS